MQTLSSRKMHKRKFAFVQGEPLTLSAISEDPFSWNVKHPRALLMVKHEAEVIMNLNICRQQGIIKEE
jgi:hypothetical protein